MERDSARWQLPFRIPDVTIFRWGAAPARWGPPLLFGLRLWAAVCLALYVAFSLELDDPHWAGTSAALASQPRLGASLRKGWFRVIGTLVGAVAIVVLTACFPQDRAAFLVGLALWSGACALVATLLRNFASYAAALAGYTAAIIASDLLGATGGVNGDAVFMLAITRVSEICIGIVCAEVVSAGTDLGSAPRRLAALFAGLSAELASRFGSTLASAGSLETQTVRRELTRRVIALDPVIDEAVGESWRLRYNSPVLQRAVDGLFAALCAWRIVAARLARLPADAARRDAEAVLHRVPLELRPAPPAGNPTSWMGDQSSMLRQCDAAVRMLIAVPAHTPSLRLLADQTARVLAGLSDALRGLAWLVDDRARPPFRRGRVRLHVPDALPAILNGLRAFVTIGAVALFWIVTAWPNGATAITFTAIAVILFAPKADAAYASAFSFMVGVSFAAVFAGIAAFAALPNVTTFAGFSAALALFLVPMGALMAQPWQSVMFTGMAGNFMPILAPYNFMHYDTVQFYNAALAIVAGCSAAALSFRLLPPLPPALRTRRLLTLTLRDLRCLAIGASERSQEDWAGRMYSRLEVLPDAAEPLQRARLLAALSVGTEIIHLRRVALHPGSASELDRAFEALAEGKSAAAITRLMLLDQGLASLADSDPRASLAMPARARILAICDALADHRVYFDGGAFA